MALSVPSTQTIAAQTIAAIESEFGKSISLLPKSFTRVLTKAFSGVWTLVYKYAAWSHLQKYVAYASFDETEINGRKLRPLVEWGRLIGIGDPRAATNAELVVLFSVLNPDGTILRAGAQLVHPSTGVIYITLADVTLNSSLKSVAVLAASDPDGNGGAGIIGNRQIDDKLEWTNPIAQLAKTPATVTSINETAEDAETESAYRQRVIDWFSARPQGGAYADYRIWALEQPGIVHAYPYTGSVPGSVDVYVEASTATSVDGFGTPTPAQMDGVAALINLDSSGLATRRPISAAVLVRPITRQPINVTVSGLNPDTTESREVIQNALTDYLLDREPFILGLSRLPRKDRITRSGISGIVDDAASTVGASVTTVSIFIGVGEINAYSLDYGQKARLGTVSY